MLKSIAIAFIYLSEFSGIFSDQNDVCTFAEKKGVCKRISDCPKAQDLFKSEDHQQLCGTQYVCCVNFTNATNPNNAKLYLRTRHVFPFSTASLAEIDDDKAGKLSRTKCLKYYPKPRIPIYVTGGKPSLARQFPHMAIIGYGDPNKIEWECGGSLISKKFVLTAAHCLSNKISQAKYVRLGDVDLSRDESDTEPQDFTVLRTIPHPDYKSSVKYHDIGLIELNRTVTISAFVAPACLQTEKDINATALTATGWGHTSFGGIPSSIMMNVDLRVIPHDQCVKDFGRISPVYLPNSIDDETQVCAGGTVGKDTCRGDSGGPLQVPNLERSFLIRVHTIIGVTSFGKACGLSKSPGIYTRVSSYIPWIESIVWENEAEDLPRPLNR